jgi:hypothetical protein
LVENAAGGVLALERRCGSRLVLRGATQPRVRLCDAEGEQLQQQSAKDRQSGETAREIGS